MLYRKDAQQALDWLVRCYVARKDKMEKLFICRSLSGSTCQILSTYLPKRPPPRSAAVSAGLRFHPTDLGNLARITRCKWLTMPTRAGSFFYLSKFWGKKSLVHLKNFGDGRTMYLCRCLHVLEFLRSIIFVQLPYI